MEIELSQLREFLKQELVRRKNFNPLYSIRAFSRDIGLSFTSLNSFISGKRDLNLKNIDKIFKYLKRPTGAVCSWCGSSKRQSKILIGGPKSQYICKSCVEVCNEILRTGRLMN